MPSNSPSSSPWEPPPPEELQRMLPQYEIISVLGRGGMGAVYKARQTKLNRTVAIKVLPETLTKEEDQLNFAKRFEQEAQAMANLDHPAIISVYDFGETAEGQLYFVMEFVDGMDIHQYLRHHGGKLPQQHALAICAHVLDALEYAHQHGIVHRDIKPANILLSQEGRVKIADFGLAKKFGANADRNTPALTKSDVVVGTPDFVAPEALDSDQVPDHRADIYAVGVMLYQLLTGKLPRGNYQLPSELNPELDPRLDEIVGKAMAANPDFRYVSAASVREDLDLVLSGRLSRIEAGQASGEVKAAVPVTTSLRGKKTEGKPLALGLTIGASALVIVGLVAILVGKRDEPETLPAHPPVVTVDKTPQPPVPPAIASVPKPVAPAVNTTDLARATKDTPFENSLGMKFVPVPGTEVLFCIHEVRWKDYAAYAKENPGIPADWKNQTHDGFVIREKADEHPVVFVSWQDAKAFCAWLSQTEKKEGRTYRLLTDHEWSLAVGIGNKEDRNAIPKEKSGKIAGEYPWGLKWPPPQGVGNYSDQSRNQKHPRSDSNYFDDHDDTFPTTAPVTSFKPNQYGLYDLGGNVWEWVEDKLSPTDDLRVLRGGSWNGYAESYVRSSYRIGDQPGFRSERNGFRCVVVGAAAKSVEAQRVDPPLTAVQPKTSPPVGSPQATPADPLADLPGLQTRLNNYLNARNTQLTELATQYSRGLDSRLNQAASAGDLKLTSAYGEEKARVAALISSFAAPVTDPRGAVRQSPTLPELPGDSPGPLVALRQTWTGESGKILATLEAALQQSLQALEAELTRARDLEKAKSVLAFRESLAASFELARATKDAPFENSLGMKFVPVPGTEVLMCIHETRRGDYAKFAAQNAGLDGTWSSIKDGDNYPVVFVNWHEAQAFCAWLTQKEGVKHRLPTDREWSFAVGIGDLEDEKETPEERSRKNTDHFPWGSWPPPNDVGNYADGLIDKQFVARGINQQYADGHPGRAPVMQFKANQLGLYDLGGNAWEWSEDWRNHTQTQRVMRGSSFWGSSDVYSSRRLYLPPEERGTISDLGFRCVIELPSSSPSAIARAVVPPPVQATSAPLPGRASVGAATPASATKDAPFENSLGMKFVPVPGTDALFCIHEVRWKDYAAYAKENPGIAPGWKNQTHDGFVIREKVEDHPVVFVSWEEANAFCAWLSQKEKKDGRAYRLSTDHEWSLAVGIGKKEDDKTSPEKKGGKIAGEYPWGSRWPPPQGAGNYSDQSRKTKIPKSKVRYLDGYDDTFPTTAPTMNFKPNQFGIYDLGGNVYEWVEDKFSPTNDRRVLRGGSWDYVSEIYLRSSDRGYDLPASRSSLYGFRCVVSAAR